MAIGDFTYMQNYFKAFKEKYPHLKVDLWIDEVRRTWKFWKWDRLKKYSLYDWTQTCPFFNKVYTQTYSPSVFKQSIQEAKKENYHIVVSLSCLRAYNYADLARIISHDGFITGMEIPTKFTQILKRKKYKKLNSKICFKNKSPKIKHITKQSSRPSSSIDQIKRTRPAADFCVRRKNEK